MSVTSLIPDPLSGEAKLQRERERMHQQLLSSVSHDLKTPLSAIIGSLEIYFKLGEKLPAGRKDELLKTAMQEAYRLDTFITNILDIAKLENGMVKAKDEESNLTVIIENCLEQMAPLHDTPVDVRIAHPEPVMICSDPVLVGRVLSLLIDNAVKYAQPDPRIRIEHGKENGLAYVRVCDNGPGIPDDKKEHIFNKFTRLLENGHKAAGTGLGLVIARSLAQLLGGTVSAADNQERGACFIFTFAGA